VNFWKHRRGGGDTKRYGNKRQTCDLGHSHRSKLESAVCQMLQLRARAGELRIIHAEAQVKLTDAQIVYIADFKCQDCATGDVFYVEAKGFTNDRWPIIKKLWAHYGPAKLEIWQGSHVNPRMAEVITPKERTR
jgi:hypothetical protein